MTRALDIAPGLYVGGHADVRDVEGKAIQAVSRQLAHLSAPWVLGDVGPLTHIFALVQHDDSWAWRLDAAPPFARWHPADAFTRPTALWRVTMDPASVELGIEAARALDGHPYDLPGLMVELSPLTAALHAPTADVCTGVGLKVLSSCSGAAASVARDVAARTRIPEALGQALRQQEGTWWCKRAL